jgi:hypothetical protein
MKKTIARQLGIKHFPFEVRDEKGNVIYLEYDDGFWARWEYDDKGNEIYFENCKGQIKDNRPKPQAEPMTIEIDGKKYKLIET